MLAVTQADVEALLLTQPDALAPLMVHTLTHLRAEVRRVFPARTTAEELAVCALVLSLMQEGVEHVRLELGRIGDDHPDPDGDR